MTTRTVSARPSTTAEDQILLNCARQEMSPGLIAATKDLLLKPVDWENLTKAAWRHGVAPLLQQHMSSQGLQSFVPNESKNELRQSYVRAAFRGQTHFAALAELLREFEKQALPVMLLKGAALGLTTYRDRALRPFADIDLLIREEKIDAAKAALMACGYTLAPELTSETLSRRFHVNLPFAKSGDRPVHVELHWNLTDRFSTYELPLHDFWQRARRIAVEQTTALVLETHDAIIYLAAHLDKHGYLNRVIAGSADAAHRVIDELSANRLIWFTDLHELISNNAIDWNLIEACCGNGELRDVVATTLQLLRDLLGTKLAFAQSRRPRFSKRLMNRIAQHAARNELHRRFFRKHVLTTRKGFELRLVRLADFWDFAFPRDVAGSRVVQASKALNQSASLGCRLTAARLRNFVRRRL